MAFDPTLLQAGDLRHSVIVTQENANARNSFGQPLSTWNTVLTTRAKIQSTTGMSYKELIQNNIISSETTHLITLRWPGSSAQLAAGMKVLFGDKTYLVQGVDNVLERNRVVRLFCMVIDGAIN